MPETTHVEAIGSLHLMHDDNRISVKFVHEKGTPFTTIFMVADVPQIGQGDISRYRNAKVTVTIEYEDKEYTKRIS